MKIFPTSIYSQLIKINQLCLMRVTLSSLLRLTNLWPSRSRSNWNLEVLFFLGFFYCYFFRRGETGVTGEKPLGTRTRTNHKLNQHMTPYASRFFVLTFHRKERKKERKKERMWILPIIILSAGGVFAAITLAVLRYVKKKRTSWNIER